MIRALTLLPLVAALTACVPADSANTDALYVGECDLFEMRRRAVSIVDNADPDFAAERSQYRMHFTRRSDTQELVLFHQARPGTQAASTGGGYVLVFAADTCKFDRLEGQRN